MQTNPVMKTAAPNSASRPWPTIKAYNPTVTMIIAATIDNNLLAETNATMSPRTTRLFCLFQARKKKGSSHTH
jgi:hypothetical protein